MFYTTSEIPMIRFRCKECGKKLKAEEEIIGRKVRCARCESIETVPPEDNLEKPGSKKRNAARLATTEPNAAHGTSTSSQDSSGNDSISKDDSVLGDDRQPVELFGHSGTGPSVVDTGQPRFKSLERKKYDLKRFVPFALIGIVVVGIFLVAINNGWIFSSGPRYGSEFEALPAVANYRRAQNQLEKSRRVMMVIGEALTSRKSVPEDMLAELEEFNQSILDLTQKIDTLDKAYEWVNQDEQAKANKLLTDEAIIMDDLKPSVDRKTAELNSLVN
jgi:DNA-directed RNA polymerase subunit M/transcription elongation factor TFIIS